MNPIFSNTACADPEWKDFCVSTCPDSSSMDGRLVNLYTTVLPRETSDETEIYMQACAIMMANWVLDHLDKFAKGDRFQIIIDWPTFVRHGKRQVLKTGGAAGDLLSIVRGDKKVVLRDSWKREVFDI